MNTDLFKTAYATAPYSHGDPIAYMPVFSPLPICVQSVFHLWLLTAMLRRARTEGGEARNGPPEHRSRAQVRDAS